MTGVILTFKFIKLLESIREIVFNIVKIEPTKEKSLQKENLPDSKKIVRSNYRKNDELGYFSIIER